MLAQNASAPDQSYGAITRRDTKYIVPKSQAQDRFISDTQNHYRFLDINITTDMGTMFQSSKSVDFVLKKGDFQRLKSLSLRLKIDITSSAATLAPVPYWFNKIDLTLDNSNTAQTWYPETIEARLALLDSHERTSLKQHMAYGSGGQSWFPQSAEEYGSIPSGGSRYFHVPIIGSLLEGINGEDLTSNITFKLVSRASGIVVAGSGTPTLSEAKWIVVEAVNDTAESKTRAATISMLPKLHYYIDTHRFGAVLNSSVVSGNTYKIQLDNLPKNCLSPGILVQFRKSSYSDEPQSGYNNWKLSDPLGGQAARLALLKNNQAVCEYNKTIGPDFAYRNIPTKMLGSDLLLKKPWYLITPCDFKSTVTNKRFDSGWFNFDGSSRDELEIIPVATTSFVQTLTLSGQSAAGTYILCYGDCQTDPIAYNATTGTITAQLDGLKSVREDNLVITPSATVSAGTSLTFTFTGGVAKPRSFVKLIPMSTLATSAPAAVTVSSNAWTTLPTNIENPGGFTASQAYYIDVYVFYFRLFGLSPSGMKVVTEMD